MIAKLLLISLISFISAPQDTTITDNLPGDTSNVEIRTIDRETLESVTDEPAFNYEEVPQNPDSMWNQIRRWIFQTIGYLMDNQWTSVVIKFIFFTVFGIVLIAVINQILGGNLGTAFSGKKAGEQISLNITEEKLKQQNYDELLKSALSKNQYDEAVRILYLKTLMQLTQAGLISWKADKTNSDYMRELAEHPAKSSFSRLTYFYEYVEYGDFKIDEQGFHKFQDLYQKIKADS